MYPPLLSNTGPLLVVVTALAWSWPAVCSASDAPRPTPRPGTLGAYARTITLDRSALGGSAAPIILTNDTVADAGKRAAITLGAVITPGRVSSNPASEPDGSRRARWKAAHDRQRRVIEDLERRKSLLELEIDHLENQRLTPKILARLDRAESKRGHFEREIARARQELARIVRDARRHGAEPGWFR